MQPSHAGLHRDVHVVGAESQDAIHAAEIHTDAAVNRDDSPFDRRARAERDDRHSMLVTEPSDGGDFVVRQRIDHAVRPLRLVMRDVLRVLVEIAGQL
ncbi:MAG: hypothetical protein FD138_1096 [Planctomycetota bacterium]|nr:MAG: hypothetical protein FD138_1096 [Planctomycetota bacterium]